MKKILLLVCSTLLLSCSNDGATTAGIKNCAKNTSSDKTISPNSIQVTVETDPLATPLEGVTVQLDHNGTCLITDKNGFARFDGLSTNKHDIHVFGTPGYEWESRYNIDTSIVGEIYFDINKILSKPSPTETYVSYVNIDGSITNSSVDSKIKFSYLSSVKPESYWDVGDGVNSTATAYNLVYGYKQDLATSVDVEFWVFENIKNALGDYELADAFLVSNFTTATTSQAGTANNQNIPFQLAQAKLQKSQVINFGNILYPTGLSFSAVYIGGYFPSATFTDKSHYAQLFSRNSSQASPSTLTPSTVIEAYTTPFDITKLNLQISASGNDSHYTFWNYLTNKNLIGATGVTVTPRITNIPLISSNRQGDTIVWSSTAAPLDRQNLYISNNGNVGTSAWNIVIEGNASQVTLPKIPTNVVPMLNVGTEYRLNLSGSYFITLNSTVYEYEYEDFSSVSSWIR